MMITPHFLTKTFKRGNLNINIKVLTHIIPNDMDWKFLRDCHNNRTMSCL